MPDRLGLPDALERFAFHPLSFLAEATVRDESGGIPYTRTVLVLVSFIFVMEVGHMLHVGADSTYLVASYFFVNHPWLAWPLAPFIHKGLGHFGANVAAIYIAAPVELGLSRFQYLGLLILSGFLPVYSDGLKLAVFGAEPNVAVYGASGFALGLAGFGLVKAAYSDLRLTPRWWLIVLIGIAGVAIVLKNIVLTIVAGDPVTLHLGHLGGLLVGLGLALLDGVLTR